MEISENILHCSNEVYFSLFLLTSSPEYLNNFSLLFPRRIHLQNFLPAHLDSVPDDIPEVKFKFKPCPQKLSNYTSIGGLCPILYFRTYETFWCCNRNVINWKTQMCCFLSKHFSSTHQLYMCYHCNLTTQNLFDSSEKCHLAYQSSSSLCHISSTDIWIATVQTKLLSLARHF